MTAITVFALFVVAVVVVALWCGGGDGAAEPFSPQQQPFCPPQYPFPVGTAPACCSVPPRSVTSGSQCALVSPASSSSV